VHQSVMVPAQQHEVVEISRSVMRPMLEMVAVAPSQRPVAGGEHATPVANGQGVAL
jgi:hypothetical protein